jgi:uncharacterized protein (TIGR02145 family)
MTIPSRVFALIVSALAVNGFEAQGVLISTDPGTPHPSAGLEISYSDKGLLPPRMTTVQRDAINAPAVGLRIFNTTTKCENFYNGLSWFELCGTCIPGVPAAPGAISGVDFQSPNTSSQNYSIAPVAGAASYNWSVPTGWSINSGQGSTSITVTTGANGQNGTISVNSQNGCGTSGNQTFPVTSLLVEDCGTVSDIDGNVYPTTKIGDYCWMAENLRVSHYRSGSVIPEVTDSTAWVQDLSGAWVHYDNNAGYDNDYGKLYNWYAVNHLDGLCPSGWHIPSMSEWYSFVTLIGGESIGGGRMKATGTSEWQSPNLLATNQTNFSALPGGRRDWDNNYYWKGETAYFWSSIENGESYASAFLLFHYNGQAYFSYSGDFKIDGMSVRCLKD